MIYTLVSKVNEYLQERKEHKDFVKSCFKAESKLADLLLGHILKQNKKQYVNIEDKLDVFRFLHYQTSNNSDLKPFESVGLEGNAYIQVVNKYENVLKRNGIFLKHPFKL